MITLLARTGKFVPVAGCPTITNKAGWTYITLSFVSLLWVTAITTLFVDWPSDWTEWLDHKRCDWVAGIHKRIGKSPMWACFAMDVSSS